MAGLCGVVKWAMEGACAHLVSTSGMLGFALSLCYHAAPKPQDKYHGKGIKLDLCVGSQVRCTRNLYTMVGLYQGARGAVVGFGFPDKKNPHKSSQENDQENTTKPED